MAATKYTYSIQNDFPNHKVDIPRLTEEIEESEITVALDYIEIVDDDCNIWFKNELDGENRNRLDTVVANHSGEPLEDDAVEVKIEGARFDSDGKQVIVPTPAPGGSYTWYTSCGDDLGPPVKRGEGTVAHIVYAAEETGAKNIELQFAEGVYLHDGEINWKPVSGFSGIDLFSVYVKFAVSSVTPNPGGTGNCNLMDAPYNYIVIPAAGDGEYDVDLSAAVPIPDSSGPWVVNERTEEITIYTDSAELGKYDQRIQILLVEPPPIYLCRNVSLGSPRGVFEIDAYLVEWISRHWKLGMVLEKNYAGTEPCEMNGFMMLFRWHATSE